MAKTMTMAPKKMIPTTVTNDSDNDELMALIALTMTGWLQQ